MNYRNIFAARNLAVLFACAQLLLLVPAGAEDDARPSEEPKPAAKTSESFVRVMHDESDQPLFMETAIVSFVPVDKNLTGLHVDLVGVVHVAEKDYYEQLNKRFELYDAVLYELVAPEGVKIPKGGRKEGGGHPITALQNGMKNMLELEFQLEHIDYTKENFIHADMTPEEFAQSMKDRDESFIKTFFRLIGHSAAMQAKGGTSDADLLMALFAKDRAVRLKRIMAAQFEEMDVMMMAFDGPDGSTIITERNKKALSVLDREIKGGKKRIAVFYGAGHLPDLQARLLADHGMRRTGIEWLPAWSLRSAESSATEQSPQPKADDE